MKALNFLPLVGILLLGLTFQSCLKDDCKRTVAYTKATPVYKSYDEIRTDLEAEAPRTLKKPGKMFLYGNHIFINEVLEGIHVIDNSNPEDPVFVSFINVPGNIDLAIRNNILYADNEVDLVSFDISDPVNARMVDREEDVFQHGGENGDGEILVHYLLEDVEEQVECGDNGWRLRAFAIQEDASFANFDLNSTAIRKSTAAGGIAGSMSRFGLYKEYLYTVDEHRMGLFNLTVPESPAFEGDVQFDWWGGEVETIFPHGDNLFMGTTTGMLIYNVENPSNPVYRSQLAHATSCDPVFVKDNYAYVTLRDGSSCQGFNNQLDLIDISNLNNPVLKETFEMDNPHGLTIFDETLFLCEGKHGMKVFDISDPLRLDRNRLAKIDDFFAYDAISFATPSQNVLMVIGEDGFYQYNFDNVNKLKLLSQIAVEP